MSNLDAHSWHAILTKVLTAADTVSQGCERAFAAPITPDTLLVADLGCQSLDIVMLVGRLSQELQLHAPPLEHLFFSKGEPVADISLKTLADFLWDTLERNRLSLGASECRL